MKKIILRLGLLISVILPGITLAQSSYISNVNNACGYTVINSGDCVFCHAANDLAAATDQKTLYLTSGGCGFCPDSPSCTAAPPVTPPTEDQLLVNARDTTKAYFEALFGDFMFYMNQAGGDFASVFPFCPDIAPKIASNFSRDTGYLVRRVTERTRNSRNIPDSWELEQLRNFAQMAAAGEPRTQFDITKPDGNIMPTMEYEIFDVVYEPDASNTSDDDGDDNKSKRKNDDDRNKGKSKDKDKHSKESKGNDKNVVTENVAAEPRAYFRYMRSITMPGLDKLPCLKCHGTPEQVAPGVQDMVDIYYPYDQAMGYAPGDIRGAWTIKIPITTAP